MAATWQHPDLDEVAWSRFVVNNEKVRPFLRNEGERRGMFFELQGWRREGWIARLRTAGFVIRTLEDRVRRLQGVADDLQVGPEVFRPSATSRERIASWDMERLGWHDLTPVEVDGLQGVRLYANEPVRRRKSRGSGDYFIAHLERGGTISLRPVSEKQAILHAYGLMASRERPAIVRFDETPDGYYVAEDQLSLPAPHRELLSILARQDKRPWTFAKAQAFLAEGIFEKLGIELRPR